MVLEAAARFGDRPALVDGPTGMTVSYRLPAERVQGVAAGLAARGFRPGDVLALWAPNLPQWELAAQLADAGALVLVTVPPLVPAAREAAAAAGVREVVVLGQADGAIPILDLLSAGGLPPDPGLDPATAVGLLPYSSGTTGLPKGVLLTHANLVTSVRQVGSGLRVGDRDVLLAVPPFSHIMGFLITLAMPLCAGATVGTVPRFDPGQFLELLVRHRVTVLVGAPPMLRVLTGHPLAAGADLGALELVVCGGAPLTAAAQRALAARLPGATVAHAWGLTETTVGVTLPDRATGSVPGTVGRVMPNTELRVVDPDSGATSALGSRASCWPGGPRSWPATCTGPTPARP
jgi:acyl-CoA synthetase (AMP-forming)/AMP-acid ligase II